VVEGGEDFCLALEPGKALGVSRDRCREQLEGNTTFQIGVGRPVHLAHSPHTDLGGHLVDAETRAGSEGQTIELYERSDSAGGITTDQRRSVDPVNLTGLLYVSRPVRSNLRSARTVSSGKETRMRWPMALALLLWASGAAAQAITTDIPGTPAGQVFQQWLGSLNSAAFRKLSSPSNAHTAPRSRLRTRRCSSGAQPAASRSFVSRKASHNL
jgi:hypothetical protein